MYIIGLPPKIRSETHVSKFTQSGQIVLLDSVSDVIKEAPDKASLILATEAGDVAAAGKLHAKVEKIDPGNLSKMLKDGLIDDLLVKEKKPAPKPVLPSSGVSPESFAGVAEKATPIQVFAKEFLEWANLDPEGVVSTIKLKKLIGTIDGLCFNNAQLAAAGWLIPYRKEGASKIGGYTASNALREEAGVVIVTNEPANAFERAEMLVRLRPQLKARKAELEAEIAAINEKIRKADAAEEWLNQGDKF